MPVVDDQNASHDEVASSGIFFVRLRVSSS